MSITRDNKPHVIVVERVDPEAGEIDWHVEHNNDCAKEEFRSGLWDEKNEPMECHACGVQHALDSVGLEPLASMLELDSEYLIPVGRHTLIGVYEYDHYSHEGDFWFEEVKGE